jgi:hypothetical protein
MFLAHFHELLELAAFCLCVPGCIFSNIFITEIICQICHMKLMAVPESYDLF